MFAELLDTSLCLQVFRLDLDIYKHFHINLYVQSLQKTTIFKEVVSFHTDYEVDFKILRC